MTMMTHTKTTNMKFQLFRGSSKSLNSLTTAVIAKKEFPIHCPTFFNGGMIHFNSTCKIFEITENISRIELKKMKNASHIVGNQYISCNRIYLVDVLQHKSLKIFANLIAKSNNNINSRSI